MSFLQRAFGGGSGSKQARLNVSYFTRLRDDAKVEVVGEYYRQGQVRQARPPGPDDLPPGMPPPPTGYYKALLVGEPTNQHDRNAIMVCLWSKGAWTMSGYLSRTDALAYQPVFGWLAYQAKTSPPGVACDAALKPERGGVGVVLHLGTPGECIVELATDGRTPVDPTWAGKAVVFTGQCATTIYRVPLDREAQIMLARWAGADVLPRLTKKTDALIVADQSEVTSNVQKARGYGVVAIQERDFIIGLGIPAQLIGRVSERWART
jgi:NAD-dependent DNA ligase